jgi:hypothetical protein
MKASAISFLRGDRRRHSNHSSARAFAMLLRAQVPAAADPKHAEILYETASNR